MGFQQNEIAAIFTLARSTISKRVTADNEDEYKKLKNIILEEAAREAGKLLARASFARLDKTIAENGNHETTEGKDDDTDKPD